MPTSFAWLTPHFHRALFDQPAGFGLPAVPVPIGCLASLTLLCEQLEQIRLYAGGSLTILSGYRSPAYNTRVLGHVRSFHTRGMAADIRSGTLDIRDLHALVRGLIRTEGLLICGLGLYADHVHVDVRPGPLVTWYSTLRRY